MTSKCLKSKILSVALCFLLGGALSDLNSRVNGDAGGNIAQINRSATFQPSLGGGVGNTKDVKVKSQDPQSTASLNQAILDSSKFSVQQSFNVGSERNSAAKGAVEEQNAKRYALERRQTAAAERVAAQSKPMTWKYGGGSNIGVYNEALRGLHEAKTSYKDQLKGLNLDPKIEGLLRDTNRLATVTDGDPTKYFKGEKNSKDLAKAASAATGEVFGHIKDVRSMPLLKAALGSLECHSGALKAINEVKVSLPDHLKYLANGSSKIKLEELMNMHDSMVEALGKVSPDSARGQQLREQLDQVAELCTTAAFEKVEGLNGYKRGTGEAGLDMVSDDNVLINLKKFEENIDKEINHYQTAAAHHQITGVIGANELHSYVFDNHELEYNVLADKDATVKAKNDASISMLKTVAESGKFKDVHEFINKYTHPDQLSAVNDMHSKKLNGYTWKDENGREKTFQSSKTIKAGDIARYLNGQVMDHEIEQELSKYTEKQLTDLYVKVATEHLDEKNKWYFTIPEEDYNSRMNEHEEERQAEANRKVGVQNNKNKATEEK